MKYSTLNRKELGALGEKIAAEYLKTQKIYPIAANYRSKYAEIDLIALDRDVLVFVEVKTRRSLVMGAGIEAINEHKIKKIRTCVGHYLLHNHVPHRSIRIDAVDILLTEDHPPRINHLPGVA